MQVKKIEELIDDMELLIMTKEADLEYVRSIKAKITFSDKSDKEDKGKIDNIDVMIPQKEEELNGLKFVTERYAERLAKERSEAIRAETSN